MRCRSVLLNQDRHSIQEFRWLEFVDLKRSIQAVKLVEDTADAGHFALVQGVRRRRPLLEQLVDR